MSMTSETTSDQQQRLVDHRRNALVPQFPLIESVPDQIDESKNDLSAADSKSLSDLNDEYTRNNSQELDEEGEGDEDGQDSMDLQNKENRWVF